MTHLKGKNQFHQLKSVDIIRSSYYIHSTAPELMKLIVAVSDVSLTTGLTRCYKAEGFSYIYLYLQFLYIFYAISITYPRSIRRISICLPNFDEICQSTAETSGFG